MRLCVYLLVCRRYFIDEFALKKHNLSKVHKKRSALSHHTPPPIHLIHRLN